RSTCSRTCASDSASPRGCAPFPRTRAGGRSRCRSSRNSSSRTRSGWSKHYGLRSSRPPLGKNRRRFGAHASRIRSEVRDSVDCDEDRHEQRYARWKPEEGDKGRNDAGDECSDPPPDRVLSDLLKFLRRFVLEDVAFFIALRARPTRRVRVASPVAQSAAEER